MPIEKPAKTCVPIHSLLAARWSRRAFSDEPVSREVVLSLMEAARWSQSCFNEQPWRFIIAARDDPEAHAKLVSCISQKNQRWAPRAWVLMIGLAVGTFAEDGSPNRMAQYDVGQAVQNMVVQATSCGLNVRQMAGIDVPRICEMYRIPDGVTVMAGIAVGYPGEPDTLPEPLPEREYHTRTRKALDDLFFTGEFGMPFSGE